MEIKEYEIYTPREAQRLLKVSSSTITRLMKVGLIHAAKIGKQYRIMGKELLRVVSPKLEDGVGILYNKGRRWLHEDEGLYQKRPEESKEKIEGSKSKVRKKRGSVSTQRDQTQPIP